MSSSTTTPVGTNLPNDSATAAEDAVEVVNTDKDDEEEEEKEEHPDVHHKDSFVLKVSGQVAASHTKSAAGFPTEAKIAKNVVHRSSKRAHGKLLCGEDSDLQPIDRAGQVIKVFVTHEKQGLLRRHGTITVVTSEQEPYAGGVFFEEYRRPVNLQCFVLKDNKDSNKPIAMCLQDRLRFDHMFVIHGTKPLNENDQPATTEGDVPMYPWYMALDDHDPKTKTRTRSVAYWDGADYQIFMMMKHNTTPSKEFEDEYDEHKSEVLLTSLDGRIIYGLLMRKTSERKKSSSWTVVTAPGADPALTLCLSVVTEDFLAASSSSSSETAAAADP